MAVLHALLACSLLGSCNVGDGDGLAYLEIRTDTAWAEFDTLVISWADSLSGHGSELFRGTPAEFGDGKRLPAEGYRGQRISITVEGIKGGRAVHVETLAYDGAVGDVEEVRFLVLEGTELIFDSTSLSIPEGDSLPVPGVKVIPEELFDKSIRYSSSDTGVFVVSGTSIFARGKGSARLIGRLNADSSKAFDIQVVVDSGTDLPDDPARLSVDQKQLAFGAVTVGSSSTESVVVVKNEGKTATGALTVELTGAGASLFRATTNACAGRVLVPGASCTVLVSFAPQKPGMATALLTIHGGTSASAVSELNGTGEFASIVASLDGALLAMPCSVATSSGYSCMSFGCETGVGVETARAFSLGGTPSTLYDLTFRVRGIVEGYQYKGGTRDQGKDAPATNPDFFHRGGQRLDTDTGGATYNSYQLDVSSAFPGETATYFLNSIPVSPVDPGVKGMTFPIDYTKTIRVRGGGRIVFRVADIDCRMIMNCGPAADRTCPSPRTVSLADASPAPPASFIQPYRNSSGTYGQWMFLDVTNVAAVVAP